MEPKTPRQTAEDIRTILSTRLVWPEQAKLLLQAAAILDNLQEKA